MGTTPEEFAPQDAQETPETDVVENEPTTDKPTDEPSSAGEDYKEQLNKEKAKEAYKQRQKNKLPDFEEKLAEMREQLSAEMRAEMRAEQERNLIQSYSSSQDEAELIEYMLNNRIRRGDNIVEDVKTAKILANKSKYETLEKEAGAMRGATMGGARIAAAGNPDAQPTSQFTPEEQSLISKFGLDPQTGKPLK